MATYLELHDLLIQDSDLRSRVRVAIIVAAEAVRTEAPATVNNANRMIWAAAAFNNPESTTDGMLAAVLAANKDANLAAITGASDSVLQTNVDAAVDVLAGI